MRRWFKRVALFLSGLWAFLAVGSLYSIYLSRGTPDWYQSPPTTESERLAAANQTDQKVAELFSYASDVAAAQRRRFVSGRTAPADIIAPKTFTISEGEVNAFAVKWETALTAGAHDGQMSHYVTNTRVALLDGRLVVAGMLKQMGMLSNTVASIEFQPVIDDHGRLWPRLARVYSGRLPVPWVLLSSPQRKFTQALQNEMEQWWIGSGLGADGLANRYAAESAAGKVLFASLVGQSTDSILLLPCDLGGLHNTVPLRLVSLKITDRSLTATLAPLTDDELRSILPEVVLKRETITEAR